MLRLLVLSFLATASVLFYLVSAIVFLSLSLSLLFSFLFFFSFFFLILFCSTRLYFVRKYFFYFRPSLVSLFDPSSSFFRFKLICKYIGTKLDINLFVFVVNTICIVYVYIYNIYVIHDACSILRLSMPMYKMGMARV